MIGAIATSICVSLVSSGQQRNFIWEDTDSSSQGMRIYNVNATESSKSLAISVKAFYLPLVHTLPIIDRSPKGDGDAVNTLLLAGVRLGVRVVLNGNRTALYRRDRVFSISLARV